MGTFVLSASEALYGFAWWLTTRKERTVMSSADDSAPIADLAARFCEINSLKEPRDGWEKGLTHPPDSALAGGAATAVRH